MENTIEGLVTIGRSYKLRCYPTLSKSEISRYTIDRFNSYLNESIKVLGKNGGRLESTTGKGQLYNKAQHKAKGVLVAAQKSARALKVKLHTPKVEALFTRAKIIPSKNSSFDYWIGVENQFAKTSIKIPAKSHKALNKALKDGWRMSQWCDLHYNKEKKEFYALVFTEKQVPAAVPTKRFLGFDVGLNHAYVSSDGFKSPGLKRLRRRMNQRIADKQQRKIKSIKTKTNLKQRLDRHAHELVNRVRGSEIGLAFEHPVIIGRLSSRRLQGWAGAYLASRVVVLAKELSIYTESVDPRYTSQQCPKCNYKSKLNRKGTAFLCKSCGHKSHADFVGSVNISRRASGERKFDPATRKKATILMSCSGQNPKRSHGGKWAREALKKCEGLA